MIAMCLGWKAQRICLDVIAAAESMRYLEEFFAELCTKVINHTLILTTTAVTHGIPKEVGKKLGKAKCKGPTILHT